MLLTIQVALLFVCAGYQKLDSLAGLDFDDLDRHWQVGGQPWQGAAAGSNPRGTHSPSRLLAAAHQVAGRQLTGQSLCCCLAQGQQLSTAVR